MRWRISRTSAQTIQRPIRPVRSHTPAVEVSPYCKSNRGSARRISRPYLFASAMANPSSRPRILLPSIALAYRANCRLSGCWGPICTSAPIVCEAKQCCNDGITDQRWELIQSRDLGIHALASTSNILCTISLILSFPCPSHQVILRQQRQFSANECPGKAWAEYGRMRTVTTTFRLMDLCIHRRRLLTRSKSESSAVDFDAGWAAEGVNFTDGISGTSRNNAIAMV